MKPKVAIVGGGINGCSTAYYLKKFDPELDVTVYECDGIASQASGKAGGFLSLEWNDHEEVLKNLSRFSYKLHQDLKKELPVDVGYRDLDTFHLNIDLTKAEKSKNEDIPWITRDSSDQDAIGNKTTTAQVHPHLLSKALIESSGTKVVIGEISKILFNEDDGFKGLTNTAGQVYEADVLVLAVGPWSEKIKHWFPKSSELFHFYAERVHSVVLQADLPPQSVFLFCKSDSDGENHDLEIYPRPDGTVYSCGYNDTEPLPQKPANVQVNGDSCAELRRVLGEVSESLKDAELKKSQSCYLPWSTDNRPVIGKIPGHANCFIAAGHGCWGILNGPGTGYILASMILERDPPFDANGLEMSRFQ